MKKKFKILLIIVLSICYGGTVFEFSDTEKKANFENESHSYVQQHYNQNFENYITQVFPHFDIISYSPFFFNFGAIALFSKDKIYFKKPFIPPKDKLFLFNSSFLI